MYIQLSITSMDEQGFRENHVHNSISLPYTNAPIVINSSPILMYNIIWSQPPRLKAMIIGFDQRRKWQPTPVLLPGNAHGQRSLVGCSPWSPEE